MDRRAYYILGVLACLAVIGCAGSVWASEADGRRWDLGVPPENVSAQDSSTGIGRFPSLFDLEFHKSLQNRFVFLSFYYGDSFDSMGRLADDGWWIQNEMQDEGRLLAKRALMGALSRTVENVDTLYRAREYGRSLSSADVRVQNGKFDIAGPSLSRAGNSDESVGLRESFRSSLTLTNGLDLGLNWKTTAGPFKLLLTYFITGRENVGMSLERDLGRYAGLSVSHRISPSEAKTLATLNINF